MTLLNYFDSILILIFSDLVIVTDGIIGVADVHVLDSVVQQLRAKTVACSFLHVGSSYHPDCANGLVPNQDLLFFLVTATLGSYIKFSPDTVITCIASHNK